MKYIIPPACEPTVPLLGPYQIAGYAKKIGYNIDIYNFNNSFLNEIINNQVCEDDIINNSEIDYIEYLSYKKYLSTYVEINSFEDLKKNLLNCKTTNDYWRLVDYVRCSYDLYSLKYDNLRFRIDGVDSQYRWNIWSDIDKFVDEYYDSDICNLIRKWILSMNIEQDQVIGVNITFESQLFFAIMTCRIISELFPRNKIVVGGGFVNSFINSGDSNGPISKYCDLVNSGEGEALVWYLNKNKNDISKLVNNAEFSGKRAYYIPAEKICDMKVPVCPPEISKQELESYFSPLNVIPLRFTYQCYWGKCKFCTDKEYHACLDSKYNVSEMIEYCIDNAQKGNVDCIYFLDSAIPVKVMKEFCWALIDNGIKIKWGTNSRFDPPFADEEFISMLAKAGCVFIKFGLESGSQHVLDLMDKGTKIENASKIIMLCRKYNILVHTYIMFAFPGETDEDRIETMSFILDENSHPDNYNCSEFIMYGNSIIAKELNYKIAVENVEEEGWHSASYSFTNQHIKDKIRELRTQFDERYFPADVLISTGHTIALANSLIKSDGKIVLYLDSFVRINNAVIINVSTSIVCRWRRRDGIVFLSGNDANSLIKLLNRDTTVEEMVRMGFNTNTIYELINEGFIDLHHKTKQIKVEYEGDTLLSFEYGNRFNQLKWYGYYDND